MAYRWLGVSGSKPLFLSPEEESKVFSRKMQRLENWDDFKVSVPSFPTLAEMPFAYNISYGIAFCLIFYIVTSVFCGGLKKIKSSS